MTVFGLGVMMAVMLVTTVAVVALLVVDAFDL